MRLERMALRALVPGLLVVCFEAPGSLHVGRIHRSVRLSARQGRVQAEFDLLYADQHLQAEDVIWRTYFYRNDAAPRTSGVFRWPQGLMALSFERATRHLADFPGWSVHVRMTL